MKKDSENRQIVENDHRHFLDIQEDNSAYSDEELENIFKQQDMQEDLESAALLKQAVVINTPEDDIDIDAEWESFKRKNYPESDKALSRDASPKASTKPNHQWRKIAASLAIAIMLSGIIYAAISWHRRSVTKPSIVASLDSTSQNKKQKSKDVASSPQENADTTLTASSKPELFDNIELETILTALAKHYQKQLVFKTENAKHLRLRFEWNKALTLQQDISLLNSFEHISIREEGNQIIVE